MTTFKSTLRIGFSNTYFTLWSVSEPYKHYHNKYDWSWRVDSMYIRNLSINEKTAVEKAKKFGATELYVNSGLRGMSSSFHTIGDKIETDYPAWMYPRNIRHTHGIGDIREMGANRAQDYDNEREIKALWVLYMKKDIVFCGENSVNESWKKPIVYARRRMLELGVLVRYDRKVLAMSYLETYKKIQALDLLKKQLKDGFHFTEGERVELQLKMISIKSFPSDWGFFNVITYQSKDGKLFTYKGGATPEVSESEFTTLKATISHEVYNHTETTKLKRITIKKDKPCKNK